MIPIDEYIKAHSDIYFACKTLNYRTFKQKYDGDRPLSVQVDWEVKEGKDDINSSNADMDNVHK